MTLRPLLLIAALLGPPTANAAEPRTLTLEQAVEAALANHPRLRQAGAAAAAAEARADLSRAPLLPQLTGNAAYQRSTANFTARPGSVPSAINRTGSQSSFDSTDYFNFGLSLSWLVWDFGQSWGSWQAAKEGLAAEQRAAETTQQSVVLAARTAYFEARASKALVQVARETLTNQRRHLEQIRSFVEIGTRPPIDLAQARTDRANAELRLIHAENSYATAKVRLNQAMGIEGDTNYQVADESFPAVAGEEKTLEDLLGQAIAARPDLAALDHQTRGAELALRANRRGLWPALSLSTGLTDAGPAVDNLAWNWHAGAALSWPLFEGGRTNAQTAQAAAALTEVEARADAARQAVRLEVEQARLSVRAAKAALTASAEVITAARERLRLAEGRYETGVGNALELGDAQLVLTDAEAQRVQADYQLAAARAQLLAALGRR